MRRKWASVVVVLAILTGASPPVRAAGRERVPARPEMTAWSPPVDGPVVRGYEPPERPFGPRHLGLDFAAVPGTPVRAAGNGIVAFAGQVAEVAGGGGRTPGRPAHHLRLPPPHPGAARGVGPPGRHPRILRGAGPRSRSGRGALRLPGRRPAPGPGPPLSGGSSHFAGPARPSRLPVPPSGAAWTSGYTGRQPDPSRLRPGVRGCPPKITTHARVPSVCAASGGASQRADEHKPRKKEL